MALPTPILGHKLALLVGDGAGSEAFAFLCAALATSVTFTRGVAEVAVRDCTTWQDAAVMVREPTTKDMTLSCEGKTTSANYTTMRTIIDGTGKRNLRIQIDGVGYYQGNFVFETLEITGNAEGGEFVDFSLSVKSNGAIDWTTT